MLDLSDYKFYNVPFPHIIVKNVISETDMLTYLRDNYELTHYMSNLKNLERFQVFLDRKDEGRWHSKLPSNRFSEDFNFNVERALTAFKHNSELNEIFKKEFTPYFESEFKNFSDDLNPNRLDISYGAYNVCDEAKNLIGWHLDRGNKLIAGFIYIREKRDKSDDGHLQITNGPNELIKEIPYEDNVLVAWPNLTNAWHRATVRYPTLHLRRIINFIQTSNNNKFYHDYSADKTSRTNVNELYKAKQFGFKKVNLL